MNRIGAKRQGLARLHKIVKADAELGSEVPDACAARLAMRHDDVRWILMVRPDQAACALKKGRELLSRLEIPAQNDGRNTDPGEGATVIREQRCPCLALEFVLRFL